MCQRKYALLRRDMYMQCITQVEIGKALGKSQTYMTSRFCGKECFTIDEGYKILDYMKIPYSKFTEYFPLSGYIQ